MIRISAKHLAIVCLVCLAAGWWLSPSRDPEPQPSRPVLRWIAKAAKNALWFMLIAEPPPADQKAYVVHARVGEDGQPLLDHGRGW